ncbi:immunoglobulin-like and fibronectin type III domain-containing protein 1 isoform X2 [Alligator mississippiensis]|uniref:immunoglobulin-like and fibronectin type III domain-containing protein 1 isoform X2 n=1 Tax=Alligator mississippiensis TaxID=8496 RepID=UPI0028774F97|nr:immunoglobulin-like and fibronectin type III domain-containing protein 1 isoform X2 [Alligator mississippiensis]
MASHRPVKSVKKSSVPGVTIQQFVDNIPTGCCTPDFERKPITLTLQEGKNAIFRAVVKGVPVPEVVWKRNKGEMDNPDKYQTSFNAVTNEFILQINKLTAADADLYRCSVVNEYGEAFCVVGLRIIQAGFKKKMRQVPTETQQDLKKEIQDFKKLLRKRVPQAARKKDIDMEQVWQLLLHADKKDYEKICLRYGIVDFRGMLRKLQQMKKDKEDKQAKYINSIRNLRHIKVNKEGNAMFDLEMDLKDPQSRIYLYKDGEMINYGFNDDNMKHCLKQVGKTYRFIINDLKSEDAGVYQLKVEDVDVFSTELEVDTIPVTFEHPLSEVCCSEQENAVFECSLCSPCYDAMWLHANNPIENNNKYEISVSSDGLNHKLMIKSVQPADKGTYTLDTGICSSSACLLVEPARGKRRQAEGDETDKKGQQMDRLSDKESVKKLRQGEGPGDKDHFRDTAIGKDGLYGSGLDDNKGLYSSSMGADGRHGYLGQDGLAAGGRVGKMGTGQISTAGIDGNLMENANKFGRFPGDEGGCMRQIYDQESKLGDSDSSGALAGEGVRASLYGKESMLGGAGIGGADLLGSLRDRDSMAGRAAGGGGSRLVGTGELSSLGDGESMLGVSAALGGSGGFSSLHGKDAMLGGVGSGGHAGFGGAEALGSLFGKDAALSGTSGGAGLGGSGVTGSSYGRGHMLGASGTGEGVGGAGSMGAFSSKDAMLGGASVGGGPAGAGRMGSLYGQDYIGPGAGAGSAGAVGMGTAHGKDAVLGGAHAGVTGTGVCGSEWSSGMEDSAIVGSVGTGGAGSTGAFSGKDSMLSGATADGIGALSGRAGGGRFSVDGASAGCEHAVGSPYNKDSAKERAVTGGSGQGGIGGMGSLSGEGGIWSQAGAGLGGMGSLYGKDGVLGDGGDGAAYVSGAGGLGALQGKGGKVAGAMAGTGGASPVGGKTGVGLLQSGGGIVGGSRTGAGAGGAGGMGSLYGKDGLQGEVGFDAAGAARGDSGGLGSLYGKDGMEYSAGAGAGAWDARGMGTLHGKDDVLGVMGVGSASGGGSGGIGSLYSRDSKLSKAGAAGVELRDMGGGGHLYGEDGLPGRTWTGAGAAGAGFGGVGGLGSLHGQDALLGTTSAGVDGAEVGGMGSLYNKDGMPSGAGAGVGGAGGMGFLHGKDDVLGVSGAGGAGAGGVGSLYGKDGVLGVSGAGGAGAGGVGSLYGKDGVLGVSGAGGAGAGGVGSLYGKDGVLGVSGAGGAGAGGVGSLYGKDGVLGVSGAGGAGAGGVGSLYGKDGVLGVSGAGGAGGVGSLYGKDGVLGVSSAGGAGAGGVGSLYGKDGVLGVSGAGGAGAGGVGSLYGKDGVLGVSGAGGAGGVGSLYGKDGVLGVSGAGGAGAGGVGSLYGKDGVLGVSSAGGAGAGGVGSLYGKDGVLGATATGIGVAGGMGSLYAQDGMSGRTGAHTGGAGKIGSHIGMASVLSGTGENAGGGGVGGPEGTGSLYGQDGMLVGPGVGMGASKGLGTLDGRGAVPGGVGAGVGGVRTAAGKGALADKDAVLTASGAGAGLGGEEALGLLRHKDAILKGAGGAAGAGLSDVQGMESLSDRDTMLRRAGGSAGDGLGGAGDLGAVPGQGARVGAGGADGRPGGAGGLGSVYGNDDMLGGTSALTQEGLSGGWGMGTLDSRSSVLGGAGAGAGAGAGVGVGAGAGAGSGSGMGGASALDSLHGRGSGLGGVGPGSEFRGAGGTDSFDGRDTFLGVAGAKGGISGLGGSGSSYERDSAFSGTHVDAGGKLFNEVTDGRKSGVPDEGWQGYEPMSGLHSGAFSGDRRRQMYGLDASGLSADENLGSRDRKGREGRFPQDDVREPRCHFNKRLSDVHALKRKPAELCCSLNNEQMEGSWFKDGFKLTGMDGVSFEKEGPNHRLIIDEVDDIHAGTYRFEAEGIKTEAKIFVEDPPNVDKDLQEKLMKDPLVIKAGQNAVVKIPFEGRKPVKATWLKDGCELLDDTRIHTDKADNFTRLSISSANRKDCGDYKVKLSNGSGALEVNLKLVVTDRPQSPMGPIEVVDSSITGITIQWKPPKDDGGKPVLSYAIERQQVGRQTWLTVGEADGSSTTFTTNKVEHDKSYCFRVRAINAEGSSEPLESGEVMAATKVFPGPPAPPKIVEASKEAIKLSWAVPDKTGNSRILGYIVEKRKKGSSTWAPVTDQPITERKWKVTDLKEGLQYEFRVAAVNAAGTGEASAPSESVFAQDPMDPPGHVRDLKVTNTDYTSITLAWTKPKPEDGGEAKGYMVEMRSSNNLKWTQCNTQPLRMTMYTVKGLEPKEMYFLRVRAVNDGGAGEAVALDTDIQAMPPMVTPKFLIDDTVKSFMIVKAGNFIRVHIPFEASPAPEVTWLKDGLSLPRKAITTTKQGHTQLVIPAAEFSDSGIYSILLQNELGKRDLFSFQIQVTDIPESPGPIQLQENVPNTVTITWEPSPTEKRESNLYYTVIKCDSRNGHWQVLGDLIYTNKFTLTKVIPGLEYYFRVVAKNYMGSSDPSETVQPWSIQKEKAEFKVRLPKYRGVNQNQPPRFLVQLKPHVVTTGFDCRMSCAVTGHPKPKVTWYKDGKNLSEDPTFFSKNDFGVCCLVILGVTTKDEGAYEVLATNELGCAISKTFLVVREPSF